MLKSILLAFSGMVTLSCAHAQSVGPSALNATGGSGTIAGNTYEYSIGTINLSQTFSSASLVVTDGVLQPILTPTNVAQPHISAAQLSVFPNPVSSTLFLQPAFAKGGQLKYMLTDAAGKTITGESHALVTGDERQEINMKHLAAGQYHLTVEWQSGSASFTNAYKIQKIQ